MTSLAVVLTKKSIASAPSAKALAARCSRRQVVDKALVGAVVARTFTSTTPKEHQETPFLSRWREDTLFAPSFQKESRPVTFVDQGPRALQLLVAPSDTGERMCLWEERIPPGGGTPIHVHFTEDEFFTFLEGTYKVVAGKDVLDVKAGDTIFVPRGTPHAWCNVGDSPGRIQFGFSPSQKGHKLIEDVMNPDFHKNTPEQMREIYDIAILTDYFMTPDAEELKTGWTESFYNAP